MGNLEIKTIAAEETAVLGEIIGKYIPADTVIAFWGDLGAGKTVFCKGLARGLGITERIKSPTFVLLEEYIGGRLPFAHIDAYRISEDEADAAGILECFGNGGVTAVEWAENLGDFLPADAIRVEITAHYEWDSKENELPEWRQFSFIFNEEQALWLQKAIAEFMDAR